jgi:hypothetical protein
MPGRPRTRDPKPKKPETPAPAAPASPEAPDAHQLDQAPRPGPGRPTKYDQSLLDLAYRCGKAGLIDEQIAIMLGVAPSTYYAWLQEHPEFSEALKGGAGDKKARLRNTMFQKAIGFTVPEEKVFLHEGKPIRVPTFRHVQPSDTMLIFLACNLMAEEYKHVQHIQNGGGVDVNLKNTIPAGFARDMERALQAMGERPAAAGRAPAPQPARPARATGKPGKAAAPARSQDLALGDDDIELSPAPMEEEINPPTALDLSDLEGGDE